MTWESRECLLFIGSANLSWMMGGVGGRYWTDTLRYDGRGVEGGRGWRVKSEASPGLELILEGIDGLLRNAFSVGLLPCQSRSASSMRHFQIQIMRWRKEISVLEMTQNTCKSVQGITWWTSLLELNNEMPRCTCVRHVSLAFVAVASRVDTHIMQVKT